ncbi:MAG: hypothetical protein DMG60_18665, partial [Acidobacteria bacterium]
MNCFTGRWRATYLWATVALVATLFVPRQLVVGQNTAGASANKLRFEISFPASLSSKPLDGHIMLGIAKDEKPEPRFQL